MTAYVILVPGRGYVSTPVRIGVMKFPLTYWPETEMGLKQATLWPSIRIAESRMAKYKLPANSRPVPVEI